MTKTALITGSAIRLGKSMALTLASKGYNIIIHYHSSQNDAKKTVQQILDADGKATAIAFDLNQSENCQSFFKECTDFYGPISLLINSASLFEKDDIGSVSNTSWDHHLNINLKSPFFISQAFAKQDKIESGHIINILDQRVLNLTPNFISYTISKSALWTLTQTMAMALAPNIRVNAIAPGPTLINPRQSESNFRDQIKYSPLQKGPSLEEINQALWFLESSPSITGEIITLDGGEHLGWAQPVKNHTPIA